VWKIGDGGVYWSRSLGQLSRWLLGCLVILSNYYMRGIFFLKQATSQELTTMWNPIWKSTELLGFRGRDKEEWVKLHFWSKRCHVRIKKNEDELIWYKNSTRGSYSPKASYLVLCEWNRVVEIQRQWKEAYGNWMPTKSKNLCVAIYKK
jgi:hypothetical protein